MTNCQVSEAIFSSFSTFILEHRETISSASGFCSVTLLFRLARCLTFSFSLSLSPLKTQQQKAYNDDVLKNWVIKTHERLLKSILYNKHCVISIQSLIYCKMKPNVVFTTAFKMCFTLLCVREDAPVIVLSSSFIHGVCICTCGRGGEFC